MSRLPLLTKDEIPAEYQDIFGGGMNLHRQTLHSPKLARLSREMGLYFRRDSSLPARLCELAILQVSWLARSAYEYSHHLKIALDAGLREDDLLRLSRGEVIDKDEVVKIVRDTATEIFANGNASAETFNRLKSHLANDQIIDLLFVTSFYVGFVRFTASLALEVEPEYQAYLEQFPLPA